VVSKLGHKVAWEIEPMPHCQLVSLNQEQAPKPTEQTRQLIEALVEYTKLKETDTLRVENQPVISSKFSSVTTGAPRNFSFKLNLCQSDL
jgi:hypothetical protein